MPDLISLLILLIVIGVVFWASKKIMAAFGIGEPINTVVIVLLVIVCLVAVLNFFGYGGPLQLRHR